MLIVSLRELCRRMLIFFGYVALIALIAGIKIQPSLGEDSSYLSPLAQSAVYGPSTPTVNSWPSFSFSERCEHEGGTGPWRADLSEFNKLDSLSCRPQQKGGLN